METDTCAWHDADDELPKIGKEVVWHVKFRSPKGTWLDSFIADTYDGEYVPENAWHWMYIPTPPQK